FRPFVFANHADAELFGFLELRPGAGAGDDEVGLGADGAGGAGAEAFGLGFGFVAAHGSRLPVKTIVLPLHSVCLASLTNGCGATSDKRSSSTSRLCGSWKKSCTASA